MVIRTFEARLSVRAANGLDELQPVAWPFPARSPALAMSSRRPACVAASADLAEGRGRTNQGACQGLFAKIDLRAVPEQAEVFSSVF